MFHPNGPAALRQGILLSASQLVSHGLALYLVGVLLPLLAIDLRLGYESLGAVVGVATLGYVVGSLAGRRLVARLDPNRMLAGVHLALALLFVALSFASGFVALLVVNAAIGMAAAPGWIAVVRITTGLAASHRGRVLAMGSSGGAIGLLLNAGILRWVAAGDGWRTGFRLAAICSLMVMAALLVKRRSGSSPTVGVGPLETPASRPSLGTIVETARVGRAAVLIAGLAGATVAPFIAFLVPLAVDDFGRSPATGALMVVFAGLAGIASAPTMGTLIDRSGPVRALQWGATFFAGSMVLLTVWWGPVALALAAIGFGLLNYPVWAVIGTVVERALPADAAAAAMSWGMVSFGVTASAVSSITGSMFAATGTFRPMVAAFAVGGLVIVWLAPRLGAGG